MSWSSNLLVFSLIKGLAIILVKLKISHHGLEHDFALKQFAMVLTVMTKRDGTKVGQLLCLFFNRQSPDCVYIEQKDTVS